MNAVLFFSGAVLLYGAWGALVLLGKADAREYVLALGAGLSWLGTHVSARRGAATNGADGAAPSTADAPVAAAPAAPVAQSSASAPAVDDAAPTLQ